MTAPRPLDGITVVSLEHAIAAPFCTRQLADLGARVIKIDREERRLGLSIKAANYSSEQLAAETTAYEALNRSAGNDMMNLGDILDEASKKV